MSERPLVILVRQLGYGGAETQVALLALELKRRGVPVEVVAFYPGPLDGGLRTGGVAVNVLEKRGRWDVVRFGFILVRALRRLRPAAVYSFLAIPNVLAVLIRPCLPDCRIIWGLRGSVRDLRRVGAVDRFARAAQTRLARFTDLVILNSRAGYRYYAALRFPTDRMAVVPNGLEADLYQHDPSARFRVRAELGLADHETAVGLVANGDPVKGHEVFLRSCSYALAAGVDVRPVCVGELDAARRASLSARARSLGLEPRLVWAGSRGDMPSVYSALDVLVSASWSEGLSNVVAEAMAASLPCVVTDVGDSAELVGRSGRVVAPGDADAMGAAICELAFLAREDRCRLGTAARERVIHRYPPARSAQRTLDLLDDLGVTLAPAAPDGPDVDRAPAPRVGA